LREIDLFYASFLIDFNQSSDIRRVYAYIYMNSGFFSIDNHDEKVFIERLMLLKLAKKARKARF